MGKLSATVSRAFADAYKDYAGRVVGLSEHLSDEQFWTKPYSYGNSFGHLVLHLTGNLNYYIGAQIAGTGYLRDREREFTETVRLPKDDVLRDFDTTIAMVVSTLEAQTMEGWSAPYAATDTEHEDRLSIVLKCAAHLHHHVGQMIYIEKELQSVS